MVNHQRTERATVKTEIYAVPDRWRLLPNGAWRIQPGEVIEVLTQVPAVVPNLRKEEKHAEPRTVL